MHACDGTMDLEVVQNSAFKCILSTKISHWKGQK